MASTGIVVAVEVIVVVGLGDAEPSSAAGDAVDAPLGKLHASEMEMIKDNTSRRRVLLMGFSPLLINTL